MVRLAQMECFHPAGEMDDAHLLSRLIKEDELRAGAANGKLLSNRRRLLVNPQKPPQPPETTETDAASAGSAAPPPAAAADPRLRDLGNTFC